jgi:hypothetical protein
MGASLGGKEAAVVKRIIVVALPMILVALVMGLFSLTQGDRARSGSIDTPDFDGDGCPDLAELGPNATQGGNARPVGT